MTRNTAKLCGCCDMAHGGRQTQSDGRSPQDLWFKMYKQNPNM